MDWAQFATFLIANIIFTLTLWLWNRAENRSDSRHADAKLESNRNLILEVHKETKSLIEGIREDMKQFHLEMKDFHHRLEKQNSDFKSHFYHYHDKGK